MTANPRVSLTETEDKTDSPDMTLEKDFDEALILADQDQTNGQGVKALDENMGAKSKSLDSLESETPDFMRGEVDVKEQMDRTAEAIADSIHGYQESRGIEDPDSELDASFRDTPGGLEEVIMKTDQDRSRKKRANEPRAGSIG